MSVRRMVWHEVEDDAQPSCVRRLNQRPQIRIAANRTAQDEWIGDRIAEIVARARVDGRKPNDRGAKRCDGIEPLGNVRQSTGSEQKRYCAVDDRVVNPT